VYIFIIASRRIQILSLFGGSGFRLFGISTFPAPSCPPFNQITHSSWSHPTSAKGVFPRMKVSQTLGPVSF
jgi:hypothetical protein